MNYSETEQKAFTIPQAALELGISEASVARLIDGGRLKAHDAGGAIKRAWRIRVADLQAFIDEHSNSASS